MNMDQLCLLLWLSYLLVQKTAVLTSSSLSHGLCVLCRYLGSLQANSLSYPTETFDYSRFHHASSEGVYAESVP